MDQIIITVTGALAIWLTQQPREHWKKYAPVLGLAGQPFWGYSAYTTEQWGILALTLVYTYSWCIGIKHYWGKV